MSYLVNALGNLDMPPTIRRAKEIQVQIEKRTSVIDIDDERISDEDVPPREGANVISWFRLL
jgi:hypothetical protein